MSEEQNSAGEESDSPNPEVDMGLAVDEEHLARASTLKSLKRKLREVGLKPEYWLDKFKITLGVTNQQSLEHLGMADYSKMEGQITFPWEKNALKKLMNIADASIKQLQDEHASLKAERQKEAKKELEELREMFAEGKARHENEVRQKEEKLRMAMDIAKESWLPSDKPLDMLIETLHNALAEKEKILCCIENLPDKDVLFNASGGLALEGIYLTMKNEDVLKKREPLIAVSEDIKLSSPQQGPVLDQKEFYSSMAESTFHKSMETLGLSITCSMKGGFWGFRGEANASYTYSKKTETTKKKKTEHVFISTIKYNYIPLASCYISKNQICLSSAALKELKTIENLVQQSGVAERSELLKQQYGEFFSQFGSHVNQGPLHFGGIFWWKATSSGFREEKMEEIKTEMSHVLNTYVGCSYSDVFSLGIGVDVSQSKVEYQGAKTENLRKDIHLSVTKTGGPLHVDSLSNWKEGLVASNKTWCVVDRGFTLIPVWEIIVSAHKEDFRNAHQVYSDLIYAYDALTNRHHSLTYGHNLAKAMDDIKSFLSEMCSWQTGAEEHQLKKLIDFQQKLNELTRTDSVWINTCLSNKTLQNCLTNIMESYKMSKKPNTFVVKSHMKCLLRGYESYSENLAAYSPIIKWIYHSEELPACVKISQFSSFIDLMSKEKDNIPINKGLEGSDETMCDLNITATINIKAYLDSFLGTVRQKGDTDVELLILSIVSKVGYLLTDNYFQYSLGSKEIDFMVKETKHVYKEFQHLKNSEAFRRKAFILLTTLSEDYDLITLSEVQKMNHFMVMVDKMRPSLSREILELLEKYSENKNVDALRKDLKCLISGDYKYTDKQSMESIVRGIKSVCQPFSPQGLQELNVTSFIKHQPDKEMAQGIENSQEFSNLLERLGLKDYFPRKLNKKDLHVFSISSIKPPVNETELPMCFLQMLMTLDYRCRYLVCEEAKKTNTSLPEFSATEHINETFTTIEAFFSNCSIGKTSMSLVSKENIHPMDLLMVIYHCADDFMRQYIVNKLSVCQFALPFIFPCFDISGLEMPLWSFRQIQKNILYIDKYGVKKHKEKSVCEIEVPLVSFTRVGTSSFSKSQMLNNLLSKHKHDIFFHRNCKGNGRNSILKEGLVEIFWFCPGGKDDDPFERCTSFVNLHGDGGLQNQQATFLHEIASVNVIIYSDSGNNDLGKSMFLDMLNSEKPLICLCPDKEPSPVDPNSKKVVIGLKNQNEATFMDELETTLRRMLSFNVQPINLNSCANVARKYGFQVDEDKAECKKGKEHAQKLKSSFMETTKEVLLPLSGKLWHTWCKKDKALTRLQKNKSGNIEQHKSQIEREKKNIRYEQLQRATENDFMKSFITSLRSLPQSEKLYFLQWLKIFIDELSYERILELQDQYNQLWSPLQTQNNESCTVKDIMLEEMEMLTKKLNNCMLGLEHILREVGQTYEALYEMQLKDDCFYELPKIAADIMISGFPIELMDGDASYVPLNWIGAVLTELIKIIGDRKVFVLSVLGIQSSGKSTLLNTMFGLQFAVSAGRCTRGAFMQLIEVDGKHKPDMAFDYILVIDTEGLRAMELANHSTLNHDNELATFVIGVGNMTLINVYGENPSEIKDILQIAVQAFLRMKKVKLTASCLFVHQNVGETTALDKNMEGRMNLQKELDNMTVLAAEQEHCNVCRFSDVIQFNAKTHIYYFAHLWEGNPPMAPPNPSYSKNAQEVRDLILQTGRKDSQRRVLKFSELKVRIEDLWSALRNENFVFSFKNTLEISAYRKVESNYSQWTWQLRRHVLELETKLNNRIKQGKLTSLEDKDLRDPIKCKFDAITEDLETFFTYDKDKEILIPWKASVENRMRNLLTELLQETKQHVAEHLKLKQGQNQIKNKKYYEDELFQKSKQLALSLKKIVLDSDELENSFNTLWQEWVAEINLTSPVVESPNIKADMENILFEYFEQEPNILDKLNDYSKQNTFSIDIPSHVTLKSSFRGMINKTLTDNDKSNINNMPIHLVSKIKEFVQAIKKQNLDYNQGHFHEIIHHVIDTMESTSKYAKNFTLTKTLKVDLSIFLCHMALPYFEAMHKDFQKSSNPVTILEGRRKEFFNCFIISYQGATSIKIFADFLCCKIIETMRSAVYERAALAIVDDMKCNYPDFSGNRSKLETHILKYLAEQDDFEKYRQYLHFPEKIFESYIENCVAEYCLNKNAQRLKGFLNISLGYFQKLVLSAITDSTQLVKDKHGNISEWLDEFYKQIEDEVSFSRGDLKSIEHQEIQDIEFIQEALCKAWDTAIESFKHELNYKTFDAFEKKPHSILTKELCGCWEQCPFCRAICTNTISGHDGDHCVPFHRSQALSGINWERSDEFVTEICSTLVMSDAHIIISDTKQIPYKKYREVGPNYANWSITPDTSAQPYWKWFVHHFRSNLENDYGLKFEGRGEIPAQWEEIEKDEVISNLKQYM